MRALAFPVRLELVFWNLLPALAINQLVLALTFMNLTRKDENENAQHSKRHVCETFLGCSRETQVLETKITLAARRNNQ